MFIWLTGTNAEQVLVNLSLVTAVVCVQGNNNTQEAVHLREWKGEK